MGEKIIEKIPAGVSTKFECQECKKIVTEHGGWQIKNIKDTFTVEFTFLCNECKEKYIY